MLIEPIGTASSTPTGRPGVLTRLLQAVATPHAIDRYLELVNPMVTWSDCRAQVTAIERRTPTSVTFALRPTRQWKGFVAGQYVQLGVVIDGVRQVRCFSPANREARSGQLEFTVTRRADGVVSNYLYHHARVGDVYSLSPAAGDFSLAQPRSARTLLIAGGSGITPVLSILRTLVHSGSPGEVTVLYYLRDERANPYAAELAALATSPTVTIHYVHTRAANRDGLRTGHFGADHLEHTVPWLAPGATAAPGETYVCGPPDLISAVTTYFGARDLGAHLHSESFAPVSGVADPAQAGGTLSLTRAARHLENDGATVLTQAEAAGLTPQTGCRRGICFSCTTVKTSGCTRNILTGEVDDTPDSHIQICVTAPVGDVSVEL